LDGVDVRIVNRRLREVDQGAVGEIAIAGSGVALGYHGQPELTASKFVNSPFTLGARMYLTGDLGRVRPDGCIEFAGRADSQIKLRGYRIELGEVEACLLRYAGVSQVAAKVCEDVASRFCGQPNAELHGSDRLRLHDRRSAEGLKRQD
jgi:acyl-coenzyme A synthetase/AMP-(fatty) acid ligase